MAKRPWEKSLAELTKYDWLTAVCHNKRHATRSRDLRVAIALMQMAEKETLLAWPTQQSLADLSGLADERQVRSALKSLVGTGAIETQMVANLSLESRAKLDIKRKGRGKAYRLKMFWAYEILEMGHSPASRTPEPDHLQAGRLKRTTAVLQKRTTAVRYRADHGSPTNTTDNTEETISSREGTIQGAYPREGYSAASKGS